MDCDDREDEQGMSWRRISDRQNIKTLYLMKTTNPIIKVVNYIAQIIAAVLYSGLCGFIMIYICTAPLSLFDMISSAIWLYLVGFLSFGGVVALQMMALTFLMYPYSWIAMNNIVAKIFSSVIILVTGIMGGIKCWTMNENMSGTFVFLCVLATIEILIAVIGMVVYIWGQINKKKKKRSQADNTNK